MAFGGSNSVDRLHTVGRLSALRRDFLLVDIASLHESVSASRLLDVHVSGKTSSNRRSRVIHGVPHSLAMEETRLAILLCIALSRRRTLLAFGLREIENELASGQRTFQHDLFWICKRLVGQLDKRFNCANPRSDERVRLAASIFHLGYRIGSPDFRMESQV